MATTTPNFGWSVPTSTDLVKDGATAIETLGDSIDASLVDLKGGTTGQVLAKNSNTDMDFTWTAVDPLVILDAKGDLITATAADTPARLAVGANGTVLTADSTESTGLKWVAASSGAMTLISSNTLGTATSTITFDSIPGTYTHLQLVMQAATGGADNFINMTFNNVTTSTYYGQLISARAGTVGSEEQLGATSFKVGILNVMFSGIINIPNYKNTDIKKTANWLAGDRVGTATSNVRTMTGFGTNDATTAITRFDLNCASTFAVGSTFSLYGMS
jgi:hypothetical protein